MRECTMLQGGTKTMVSGPLPYSSKWMRTPSRSTKPLLTGSLARIALSLGAGFVGADQVADEAKTAAQRRALLLEAEQVEAFRAHEGTGHEGRDLVGREGSEASEPGLGLARHVGDQLEPAHHPVANDLGDRWIDVARRDHLLQHAHVARGDIVVEIIAGAIPLLGEL